MFILHEIIKSLVAEINIIFDITIGLLGKTLIGFINKHLLKPILARF